MEDKPKGQPDIGDQIMGAIQDALDQQDLSGLSDIVGKAGRAAGRAVPVIGNAVQQGIKAAGDQIQNAASEASSRMTRPQGATPPKPVADAQGRDASELRAAQRRAAELERREVLSRYGKPGIVRSSGMAMAIIGGLFTFYMAMGLLASLFMLAIFPQVWLMMAVLLALSVWLLASGVKRVRLAKNFDSLKRIMGSREWVNVEDLSRQMGLPEAKVDEQLRLMLQRGLLPHGHLDSQAGWLAVTDGAWERHLDSAEPSDPVPITPERVEDVVDVEEDEQDDAALPADVRELLSRGREGLRAMARARDLIDDEAVSAKVAALMDIVRSILDYGRQHPECADELERLVNYYVPTTNRLLNTYDDLEEQPVQGDNIAQSRSQIEHTLDLLQEAYGNLLDSMYRNVAWDVTADAEVLRDVLKQEGLIDDPHTINIDQP